MKTLSILISISLILYLLVMIFFVNNNKIISLKNLVNIFILIFMAIVPIFMITDGITYWGASGITPEDYSYTNIIVFTIAISYNAIYSIIYKKYTPRIEGNKNKKYNLQKINIVLLTLSVSVAFFIVYSNSYSITNIYTRSKLGSDFAIEYIFEKYIETQAFSLFANNFLLPILSIAVILFKIYNENKNKLIGLLILILLLVFLPPISLPRYMAAALYIPILIIYLKIVYIKNIFNLILIFLILVAFPTMEAFRSEIPTNIIDSLMIFNDPKIIGAGHFDTYQSLLLVMKHDLITNGRQILGVLIFFIPRAIYIDKPIGSGRYIAEELGLSFNNISCNYFAEGYLNFGIIGIAIFIVILCVWTAIMDKKFITLKTANKNSNIFFITIYLYTIPFLVFILRGDMLSSVAYYIAIVLSTLMITSVCNKYCDFKNE
jgi:oligosaccharide repeat unit polymerase